MAGQGEWCSYLRCCWREEPERSYLLFFLNYRPRLALAYWYTRALNSALYLRCIKSH